jgi:CheY-like chemotaxis protein
MPDAPSLSDARILVVDDEPPNVQLLQTALKRAGYINVKATTDSRRVAGLLTEFEPDLILLDLLMPHPDGFRVMEQLSRLVPPSTYLPVLVLTADITAETKRRALAGGA